jgi:hypothetical protein
MSNQKMIFNKMLRFTPLLKWSISWVFGLSVAIGMADLGSAESPDTAPEELKQVLSGIETAANLRDIEGVIKFYSPNFTNSDGLTYSAFSQALTQMWQGYSKVSYTTKLESWEKIGNEIVAQTVTQVQGNQNNESILVQLDSTIRSRQHIQDGKIVKQDILAETTKLISGSNPPQIKVNLPEKVRIGEQFNFDVIVNEPLGNDVLLGNAVEERAGSDRYINPTKLDLKVLPSGGIFKIVKAPLLPDRLWLSAILVRSEGLIQITQRVRVEEN